MGVLCSGTRFARTRPAVHCVTATAPANASGETSGTSVRAEVTTRRGRVARGVGDRCEQSSSCMRTRTYPAAQPRVRWPACRRTAQPSSVAGPAWRNEGVQVQRCAPGLSGRRVKRTKRGRTGRRGRRPRRAGDCCCPSCSPVGCHHWTAITRIARANGTGRPRWSVPIRLVGVPRPASWSVSVAASRLVGDT